ncbi:amino acid adenylation domain-containing protein [Gordonia sp. (in: high G+C Gram-positive bacteria)]|uniref:amino acid adenylation domain-containing protein n=1 Tax=Gordonia sp. (in: high G+C Gram-positive bacteria) TaxID=84139 RepID=UPI003529A386
MAGAERAEESVGSHHLLPLTPAQRGMWFAETLTSDYSVNIAQYVDIKHQPGALDIDLIVACCEEVGKIVESPFVRLTEVDGIPMQYVDVAFDQHVDVLDFRNEDDPEGAALAWMQADYRLPVDLIDGQFIVIAFIKITDERTFWYNRCHHIILDGYAALAVMRRTVDLYNARRRGGEVSAKPPLSMSGIVAYEEAYENSTRRTTDRAHWLERVQDLPERITLSRDPSTVPVVLDNIVVSEQLDPGLQARLVGVARDCNSSIAVLLTAAFGAFLSRMTGSDDVVLSLPVTGRANAAIKRSGGMVSNILPIRLRAAFSGTARDLVDAAQLELTGALRHQRYRSEDIKRDAGLDGSTYGFGPRINMVFFDEPVLIDDADVEYRILTSGMLEDLLVNLYQASPDAPLIVDLHGHPQLYTAAEIEGHHARFLAFVSEFIDNLDTPIADLNLLLPNEGARLRALESGPQANLPAEQGLLDPYLDALAAHPERVAVVDDAREWTYAQFDALRRTLAAELLAAGVGPGDRVAVRLDRGVEQVVALYAVLTLGAAYVPIDPGAPQARQQAVLATAEPRLVADQDFLDTVGFSTDRQDDAPQVPLLRGRIAYVIFTSGSTGTPKGVEVSVPAVANRLAWMQDHYPIGGSDAVLYKTPFTFDVSVWELFWPLRVGSRMVVARAGGHRDPAYLREVISTRGVTVLHFVPSMLEVFVDAVRPGAPLLPGSVRRVFTSGEGLQARLADRVATASDARLINLYGPTEAAVEVTEYQVRGGESVIPIGRPVPATSTYVLDARLRRVPVGVAGELYLAGVQLAVGYVGQEALTAERFVADPFDPGHRMYRTGDLVRWNEAGDIEYLGRTDFQVKIRGQRIELGEIESVVLSEGSVDSVVMVVRTDTGSPAIVGYVRSDAAGEQAQALTDRLMQWCVHHLPRYMVPSAFVVMETFPVNGSGKLDRAALPAPVISSHATQEYVPPTSDAEKALVHVLGDLLGVDRIGVRDNLFGLGADSLVAARLASRLRTEQGIEIRLSDLFESQDLAEIAARMEASPNAENRLPLRRMERPVPVPVAPTQTRLWFINRLDPGSAAYNMPAAVQLGADLDVGALRAAVLDVVDRHEILRTRFPSVEGEPVQEILTPDQVRDRFALEPRACTSDELDATVSAEVSGGFDLIAEIPFRAMLLDVEGEYALVVVLHHIAGDGASLRPLVADLLTAYASRHVGLAPDWAPLPVQFADYTLWQREMLGDAADAESVAHRELEFWRTELDGLAETLELPSDRVRPRVPSGRGEYVDTILPEETARGVHELAAKLGVTPFTVVHTALAALLARLADVDDVAIGTAVAGRDEPETTELVGMFVNTVVLRTGAVPGATGVDAIVAAHRVRTRALQNSHVPFEQVVEAVAPSRSRSHSPLFQVTLTMQQDTEVRSNIEDTGSVLLDARPGVAKVDLEVAVLDRTGTTGGMNIEFCYATDLFDRDRIAALAGQLEHVIDSLVTQPGAQMSRIDVVDDATRRRLASPVVARETPGTLRAMIEAGESKAAPLGAAIVGDQTLTRRLLSARTNQLARELIARGIGAGDVVAVCVPRSHHSVIAQIAVAKSGAAFVMIDPRHPDERRASLVTDSGAVLGITSAAVSGLTGDIDWIVIDGEADELQLAGHSGRRITDAELVRPVYPEHAAYILFTSGSTGRPKGAVVSNRAIANVTVNAVHKFGVTEESCMLHVGAPSFDGAMGELAMAWLAGARLAVTDFDTFAGEQLEEFIAQHGATHGHLTPAAVATLEPSRVPTFRTVACGGEALPPEMVHRWAALGDRRMFNIYGPTEVAVWVTTEGPYGVDDEVTIGRVGAGVRALVLDRGLRPVPDGVPGELYIAGEQVGLGYLNRPDLTTTHFVANPFGDGTRMYRTGDRVTRLADGRFRYHGRLDFQLKIRGQRIEPGEIDAVLLAHPDVTNAVSVGVPGPAGDTVLASYVSVTPGCLVTGPELVEFAARRLPPFLVPRAVQIVDEFAWTPIGKIDRTKLPPIAFAPTGQFVAPRTQFESVIADIFGQVLEADRVSIHDDFFDLGGNSLSATKVVARLTAALDVQVPIAALFEAPTVASLAALATEQIGGRPAIPLGPRVRAEVVPVSGVQRGMWLVNRADPASPAYNIALALQLRGELDLPALGRAVEDLVVRHESLRTSYPMINGEPSQFIGSAESALGGARLDPIDVDGSLDDAIAEIFGVGFDVTAAPPIRLRLLRVAPDEHVVVLVIHHISADGASMMPLARDLTVAYAARAGGHAPAWTPLRVQYADFALWQAERLDQVDDEGTPERVSQLRYWKQRLAGIPDLLPLPTDRPRPPSPSFRGGTVPFEIPAELVARLEAVGHEHNATLFMVAQTAFALLLNRLSGSSDIVVGTPYVGRSDAALDDVIGMFVNTLALRTTIDPTERVDDLLGRVRSDDLADMGNTDVAFEEVAAELDVARTPSISPVFQTMFWFQNIDFPTVSLGGLTVSAVPHELVTAKVDLQLTLFPNDPVDMGSREAQQPMRGEFLYAADLFNESTVARYADWYLHILEQIAGDPTVTVRDVAISAVADGPADDEAESLVPLPDLVSAAAVGDPAGIAFAAGGVTVTFTALATTSAALGAAMPDADSALVTALLSLVPALAAEGPDSLGSVLAEVRRNAASRTASH